MNKKFHIIKAFILLFFIGGIMSSCYTFTGSSLSPETQTIQIKEFINTSAFVNPNLAQQFNIDIQNRFLQRTTLKGTNENPDILIEGEITDYQIVPTTIISGVANQDGTTLQAAQNKLVMSVRVHYENHVAGEESKSFDKTYTDEVVFGSDLDINNIEASQIQLINERIINLIFNDIVANW